MRGGRINKILNEVEVTQRQTDPINQMRQMRAMEQKLKHGNINRDLLHFIVP